MVFLIVALTQCGGPAALARKSGVPDPGLIGSFAPAHSVASQPSALPNPFRRFPNASNAFTPSGFSIGVPQAGRNVMSKNLPSPRLRQAGALPQTFGVATPAFAKASARQASGAFYQSCGKGHSSSLPQSNALVTNAKL